MDEPASERRTTEPDFQLPSEWLPAEKRETAANSCDSAAVASGRAGSERKSFAADSGTSDRPAFVVVAAAVVVVVMNGGLTWTEPPSSRRNI